jgi:hypothetical protein
VLRRYSASMESLLKNGYQVRKDNRGAIPANLLGFGGGEIADDRLEGLPYESYFDNVVCLANTASTTDYLKACKLNGVKPHPARFPIGLPLFFIEFLTEAGDSICDPFAGSNTTGEAAEALSRRWVSCDLDSEGAYANTYVRTSALRFPGARLQPRYRKLPKPNWHSIARRARPKGK